MTGATMDCGFESGEMGEPVGIGYSDGGGQVICSGGEPDGLPSMNCLSLKIPNSAERLAALSPIKTVETVETIVSTNQVCMYISVESPRLGMVFKSFEDVESYYKEYAEQKGFGVTRVASSFSKKDKERRGATWRCECWGPPDMRARREAKKRAKLMELCGTGGIVNGEIGEDVMQRAKRTSKKCECGAMLYAGVDSDGLWVIRKLRNEHDNHTPKPSDAKLVKEYRMKNYTSNVKKKLLNFYEEGVSVRQIHGCMATETGDDNLPSVKDLEHEVSKEKRLKMEGGDAAAMMAYFDRMQEDNQNFYHAHRLDEEGRIKDVLWVDARSRVAYEDFGDVVCFDATYLTNSYALPFANFVGVNHHGQSILLGCALVSHEDCDTFGWVFRQWLSCMGNKQPGSILTDQAAAMRKPLAQVMPNARHRWCIWHIMKKIPDKLGKCEHYHDFKSPLKALVYESFTVAEFERRWIDFIKHFELEDNDWLADLFEERHMWVPAFMKEHFWAGMKTTQRVESINSFFDGFVNRKTKLYEFPEKYTRAMGRRVKAETEADARCGKYLRRLVSGFFVEQFFRDIYTDTKFQEIQIECCRLMHCSGREEHVLEGNIIQYLLEDRVWIIPEGKSEEEITDRRRFYCVLYNTVTKDVSCDCCKFETFGILCRHIIRVYDQNRVSEIPSKYVLDRWRKDVPRKHTRVKVAYHDPNTDYSVQTYRKLMGEFEPICEVAASADDKDTLDLVLNSLQSLSLDVKQSRAKFLENQPLLPTLPRTLLPPSEICSNNPESCLTPVSISKPIGVYVAPAPVKDPVSRKKPRGRPKVYRHKSLAETGYKKSGGKKVETVQQPPAKLPAKRKNPQGVQLQNIIENYYDYVADVGVLDEFAQCNGVEWGSGPSETF